MKPGSKASLFLQLPSLQLICPQLLGVHFNPNSHWLLLIPNSLCCSDPLKSHSSMPPLLDLIFPLEKPAITELAEDGASGGGENYPHYPHRRIDLPQITGVFTSQFCYDLVISSQSYENMKKLYGYFLFKSFFKIEIKSLQVKIQVTKKSIYLTFSQK